ncbi:MAG TPA: hypothetical protein VMX97_18245 [Hyphomicrobiaceae bacterium]|nr:hypothetical protein [Hyphomicrobiaceae bacterium]
MKRWIKTLIATAIGVVSLTTLGGRSVAADLCFKEDEILADTMLQYFLSEGIIALRCDEMNGDARGARFFKLHGNIVKLHQAALDAMASMEKILGREKFGGADRRSGAAEMLSLC